MLEWYEEAEFYMEKALELLKNHKVGENIKKVSYNPQDDCKQVKPNYYKYVKKGYKKYGDYKETDQETAYWKLPENH